MLRHGFIHITQRQRRKIFVDNSLPLPPPTIASLEARYSAHIPLLKGANVGGAVRYKHFAPLPLGSESIVSVEL